MIAQNPLRPNMKSKVDVLRRDLLPSGNCELNFRPPTLHALDAGPEVKGLLINVTVVAAIAGVLIRFFPGLLTLNGTALVSAVGAGMAVAFVIASGGLVPTRPGEHRIGMALLGLLSVPALWLCMVTAVLMNHAVVALILMMVIGMPALLSLADRMATHFTYWQSANPRVDRTTMLGWRSDWVKRFDGFPDRAPRRGDLSDDEQRRLQTALAIRRGYLDGFVMVAACFVGIPVGCFLLIPLSAVFRLQVGMLLTASLAVISAMRSASAPGAWRLTGQALASWTFYGRDSNWPGVVFQSPAGSQLYRQGWMMVVTAVLTVLLASVVSSGLWVFSGFLQTGLVLVDVVGPTALALVAFMHWPFVLIRLVTHIIMAPVVSAWHLALDGPNAVEQDEEGTELDGYGDRLLHSNHKEESDSLISGYNPSLEYPYLLSSELLFEHMHMLGATGSGKTALGLLTLVTQLIRRDDGPVIVIDAKGDRALFNSVKLEAERSGRTFKWFTNKPHHSTYVFNPFGQESFKELTLPEILGVITQSLNLYHGEDYGRAWFSIAARVLLRAALLTTMPQHPRHRPRNPQRRRRQGADPGPVQSFQDLEDRIREIAEDSEEYNAAKQLVFLVQSLSDFRQLNLSPRRDAHESALKHAIHMPDVIRNKEVIYFSLTGMADVASVAQIARLAMYSTLTAAMEHRAATGKRPRIYFLCDEAQVIVGRNIENVLAQAREYGVAFVLAHQTMSQLNPPGGVDLRELVSNCTAIKQYFTARDPQTQKYLSEVSGTVPYVGLQWNQLKRRVVKEGELGPQWACTDADGVMRMAVTEQAGPRLTTEDILDINRDPNQSIFLVERGHGFSQFDGAFPMHTCWPISHDEHRHRSFDIPWPAEDAATVTVLPDWPAANAETVVAEAQPTPTYTDQEIQQKLGAIREQLEKEQNH